MKVASLTMTLFLCLACGAGRSSKRAPELPMLPGEASTLPAYESPKAHLDAIGAPRGGIPEILNGAVCYDLDAHLRLALSISSEEARSTQRAKSAWRRGWIECQRTHAHLVLSSNENDGPMSGWPIWVGVFALGVVTGAVTR